MKARTNMRLLRENRGYTLRQVGEWANIPFGLLSLMERGKMLPTDDELLALCETLKSTADIIYPDEELRKVLAE